MRRNVLSIIYFFPPMAGSGVQRPLKFIKYMPDFNYYPIVETVKSGHNFAYDESLLNEIPEVVKVYRSNSGETLWLRNIIEGISSIKNKFRKSSSSEEQTSTSTAVVSEPSSPGIKERVFKFIELNMFVPDSKIRWYKHAVRHCKEILKKEDVHCIFSSSYPYTVHLIALEIKKKTNLPWVADFRDPWVGNVFMTEGHSDKRKRKEEEMEREVVKYADKIIMVTGPICEMYKKRYPEYKEKFITITNGFDLEEYKTIEEIREDKFTICYGGILTEGQSPETMIKALEKLIDEKVIDKSKLKIKFIGLVIDEYKAMLSQSKVGECVQMYDYMTRKECLKHMKGADLNLLILADKEESKGVFSGKIFDYIGVERPVLGVMPEGGVASNLIIDKKIGDSFNHGEIEKAASFIKSNYEEWLMKNDVNTHAINKCMEYERKNLTAKLTNVFDELCK